MFNDFTISSRGILRKMMVLKCHNIMRVNVCVYESVYVCMRVCERESERVKKKGRNFLGVKMAIKITAGYFSNLYLK